MYSVVFISIGMLCIVLTFTDSLVLPPLPPAYPPAIYVQPPQIENLESKYLGPPYAPNTVTNGLENMKLQPTIASGFSIMLLNRDKDPVLKGGWNVTMDINGFGDVFRLSLYDLQNGTLFGYLAYWPDEKTGDVGTVSIIVEGEQSTETPIRIPLSREQHAAYDGEKAARFTPGTCKEFVIATGANSDMFDRLENLVGSIHWWQKAKSKIVVYDFGLLPEDVEDIAQWKHVKYRKFPCENYPEHVCRMGDRCTYAFKAILLSELLEKFSCVLWLDAGIEVRNSLDEIENILEQYGQFYVTNGWPFPNKFSHPDALAFWGKKEADYYHDNEVYLEAMGGIQGYRRGSVGHLEILPKLLECALIEECIAPPGSNKENFRQDQTVLNVVLLQHPLHKYLRPYTSKKFWSVAPTDEHKLSEDETQLSKDGIVLFIRRGFTPRPYFAHVLEKDKEL